MKIVKYILVVLLVALVVIQFIRPETNDSGYESITFFEQETKPSAEVASILKKNCYDCHSNHTQYPWYAQMAPFSFWLDDHIEHGKGHFNAAAWESYSLKKKDHKMEELVEMVEAGEMPLDSYTWIHGDLTEAEQQMLLEWAGLVRLQYQTQMEVSSK
ncbi:heme-binding domain-containing protein [Marixanthomonas spongiae]|uniref:Cytochrome C n=1 Tax=Marixanthomonas spongiae TaxID=2174845 RepID=A0A2U0HW43_9FLAO|nr:heme-binding domain-containing protein [Marixanthomonas spongiae]PVW13091.1 cytochrome C [Marixanthomonas spongiae]